MKNSLNLIKQKVSNAVKSHFDKNPNDIIALTFGTIVLAFILLFTPHIPQTSATDYANQTSVEQKTINQNNNTDLNQRSSENEGKASLKGFLK